MAANCLKKGRDNSEIKALNQGPVIRALWSLTLSIHGFDELGIILGRLELINQKFHRLQVIHRMQQLAQQPDFL